MKIGKITSEKNLRKLDKRKRVPQHLFSFHKLHVIEKAHFRSLHSTLRNWGKKRIEK